MLSLCLAEFLGTTLFLTVIAKYGGDEYGMYAICIALLAAIFFMGSKGFPGNFNPAVTLMQFMQQGMTEKSMTDAMCKVGGQVAGALAAWKLAEIKMGDF